MVPSRDDRGRVATRLRRAFIAASAVLARAIARDRARPNVTPHAARRPRATRHVTVKLSSAVSGATAASVVTLRLPVAAL
jgi:hypothetical protein